MPLPTPLPAMHVRALQYVTNTGGIATVDQFDDDHEPVGPMLRRDLMPVYMLENTGGKLELTEAGKAAAVITVFE